MPGLTDPPRVGLLRPRAVLSRHQLITDPWAHNRSALRRLRVGMLGPVGPEPEV